MYISTGYAHDADKAFFDIELEEKTTVVYAEFPWSIRNALISFEPNYIKLKTIKEINAVFFNYTKEKLKLFNDDGEELTLLDVVLNKDPEHTHSTKYRLIYDGVDVVKVRNIFMVEHNKNQKNYHFFADSSGEDKRIVTDKNFPSFDLKLQEPTTNVLYYVLGGVSGVLLLLGVIFSRRKN